MRAPTERTSPRRILAALALAALAVAPSAWAEDVLIKGGRVETVEGEALERGDVLIRGSRIERVAPEIALSGDEAKGVRVVDAAGKSVYPGFFAANTQLGMVEVAMVGSTNDTRESSGPTTPQVRALDAINPESSLIPVSRATGVAAAICAPGGRVIAGQSAAILLNGGSIPRCLVKSPAALHLNFGEPARAGEDAKGKPQTRMGVTAMHRESFLAAQVYAARQDRHAADMERHERKIVARAEKILRLEAKRDEQLADPAKADEAKKTGEELEKMLGEPAELPPLPPATDLEKEPLAAALRREIPVVAYAQRLDDILSAVRLAEEFNLRLIVSGGANAYKIADQLAEKKIPVMLVATENPSSMETRGALYSNAAKLHAAGVEIAIIPEHESHNVRNLPFEAGIAVAYGLPREAALRAITINPARMFGLEADLGGLVAGKLANVAIVDGDPLQPVSKLERLFIAGEEMDLSTRHTELAKPYLEGTKSTKVGESPL